jgi:hypothetical protein
VLPPPPDDLTGAPRRFYDELRTILDDVNPTAVDLANIETDFGDSGVAVTLPHQAEPGWTLTVQCSRRAAVVFAGPSATHFDERDPGWTSAAVAFMAALLRGEQEIELDAGRRRPPEVLRIDFHARG